MRIVIDLQGAQVDDHFGSITRYTLAFAEAIAKNRKEHEVLFVLNGLFHKTIEPIRNRLFDIIPQENILVWHAPRLNKCHRKVSECIRKTFLSKLFPDVIHISTVFEDLYSDAVTSILELDSRTPVTVTINRLPSIKNHDVNEDPSYSNYCRKELENLKKASAVFTSSESLGKQLTELVGNVDIVNIPPVVDSRFCKLDISERLKSALMEKFGITGPFIFYVGVCHLRNNVELLIRAYSHLPETLRNAYQILIAGYFSDEDKEEIRRFAKNLGVSPSSIILKELTTFSDLVYLYNLCRIFIFPSLHEDEFNLPILEAMQCGTVVIGSNTKSILELIGIEDALFDHNDPVFVSRKMEQALTDESFREHLRQHNLNQIRLFSQSKIAELIFSKWENLTKKGKETSITPRFPTLKSLPRLAYISPLPPERSGISNYSSELIPELSKYYDIDVIVTQKSITDEWINRHCSVRAPEWFESHYDYYDRILYHIGNSPFHIYMFGLLEHIPGVVVLHDFFLSTVCAYMEHTNIDPYFWTKMLYYNHGYKALEERFHAEDKASVMWKYPCNLHVLQNALGVIVHSRYAKQLASKWYGEDFSKDWAVIPHLRKLALPIDKAEARKLLGIKQEDFIVCSFGVVGPTKLSHDLVEAFVASNLSKDKRCYLLFVGEINPYDSYTSKFIKTIQKSGLKDRIKTTGWVDSENFRYYMACTDVAVQLRTLSRGETSGAVLDCMNYGIPIIVNAHGSMAELPRDAVFMLPDKFDNRDLVEALEILWKDENLRRSIGQKARETIATHYSPSACAKRYFDEIENFYEKSKTNIVSLIQDIALLCHSDLDQNETREIAKSIALSFPPYPRKSRLLIDVTATARYDLKTGIERSARAIIKALIDSQPQVYAVEPVYLSNRGGYWHYRYARRYTLELLNCPKNILEDEIVDLQPEDTILGIDISGLTLIKANEEGFFSLCRNMGIRIYFIIHDILPITHPEFFPPGADLIFKDWLTAVTSFDGAICVSRATAESLVKWLKDNVSFADRRPFFVAWNHHGSDIESSIPSRGLPKSAHRILMEISKRPTFLMVGTIEPRKGYLQTIEAFTKLWSEGIDVNLVIVGKEGWQDLPNSMRRTIPSIVSKISYHPELNRRLFWLKGISDEYLEKVYRKSTCLIMASEAEGFGLPLIEAARYKLPIIARDIRVFKEIAGDYAFYFSDDKSPDVIAKSVKEWLSLYKLGKHPLPEGMPCLTWNESVKRLLDIISEEKWAYKLTVDGVVCVKTFFIMD